MKGGAIMRIAAALILAALLAATGCGETVTPQKVGESRATPSPQQQVGESRATPSPQQQPKPLQKFKVGDVIEIGQLRFTVHGVREDKGNQFLHPPQGKRWIVVDATIENLSDKPTTISSLLMFKLADADGRRYDITLGPELRGHLDGELAPGSKMRGEVAFEVPKDAKGLELIFQPNIFGFGQAIVVLEK